MNLRSKGQTTTIQTLIVTVEDTAEHFVKFTEMITFNTEFFVHNMLFKTT